VCSSDLLPEPDDDQADFADEHDDTTFADEVPDGPEHARDSDSPRGRGGMDTGPV